MLPPLPLVPYALSMSTTMIYRAMRDGERSVEQACGDLRLCCKAVTGLGRLWTSARGISKLAQHLLEVLNSTTPGVGSECTQMRSQYFACETRAENTTDINQRAARTSPRRITPVLDVTSPCCPETIAPASGDPWSSIDEVYSQLDTAVGDIYDYSIPDIFQDCADWEFASAHVSPEEASGLDGLELQAPSDSGVPGTSAGGDSHPMGLLNGKSG